MTVTGVPFMDVRSGQYRPSTYEDMGAAGTMAQGFALLMNVGSEWNNSRVREYNITIQENISRPGLLRAQIFTKHNNGRHYKLWFDADGWHENPYYDELTGTW